MNFHITKRLLASFSVTVGMVCGGPIGYTQTNLTSDIPGLAAFTDANLKNPWGVSFGANTPFWVSDQVTNVATLYSGTGAPQALVVATPPASPTGQVFVGTSNFTLVGGGSAIFAFATLAGTIDAWNSGTNAITQFTAVDGAVYTGLAQAGNLLYAADTKNGKIDVFTSSFAKTTVSGSFVDPSVTPGFTPYNVQNVGGKIYVEYAQRNAPGGFVGVFDTNGNFLQNISDTHLDSPWGITLAPSGFGQFGGDLLVGNFGNGMINAFDPITGAFLGTVSNANGTPLVNSGLWSLEFRSPNSTFDPNTLFFTAGINNEADGLFGAIQPTPEPATLGMLGLGMLALVCFKARWRAN
jgi:uncharacterized protein (TIGR03118 family)